MKSLTLISLLFLIIFSCSKTVDLLTVDCSHSNVPQLPLICNGPVCLSDTCNIYLAIWKELFLTKNQMTQEYFDNHITICSCGTFNNTQQGTSFYLSYKITIDWFQVKKGADFLIVLLPVYTQQYPELGLPSNTLLSKEQIKSQMNNAFFSSPMPIVSSINHLNYPSRWDAGTALAKDAGVNTMCSSTLYIQYQDMANPPIGNPMMSASGALNWNENRCVSGVMDLATDFIKTEKDACFISFCFTRGTRIKQNNSQERSVEKLKTGESILSLNLKTMKIESDIIRQIDSVKHSDIIRIVFEDLTKNENTSDHPYYVKNRGWCSYKPGLTLQKYNIQTKQLLPGDICFKYDANKLIEVKIKDITENPGEVMTYNISRLEKNKSYFANGILVSTENN